MSTVITTTRFLCQPGIVFRVQECLKGCELAVRTPVMNFVLSCLVNWLVGWMDGWWLLLLECLNALQKFVILGTVYQMTQCIVLEDLVLE